MTNSPIEIIADLLAGAGALGLDESLQPDNQAGKRFFRRARCVEINDALRRLEARVDFFSVKWRGKFVHRWVTTHGRRSSARPLMVCNSL
jgi:hypothetical protein